MDTDLEQLIDEFIEITLVARGQSLSLSVRENRNSIEMTSHPDVDDIPSGEIRRIASNIRRAPARSNLRMRNCPMNPASRSYSDTIDSIISSRSTEPPHSVRSGSQERRLGQDATAH